MFLIVYVAIIIATIYILGFTIWLLGLISNIVLSYVLYNILIYDPENKGNEFQPDKELKAGLLVAVPLSWIGFVILFVILIFTAIDIIKK